MVAWDANGVCAHHDSVPGITQGPWSTGCSGLRTLDTTMRITTIMRALVSR